KHPRQLVRICALQRGGSASSNSNSRPIGPRFTTGFCFGVACLLWVESRPSLIGQDQSQSLSQLPKLPGSSAPSGERDAAGGRSMVGLLFVDTVIQRWIDEDLPWALRSAF